MSAAVRSSVGLALRRATAPASSRLYPANTRVVQQPTRHYGNFDPSRSMFDPEAYSRNPVPPNPELDKFDALFTVAAMIGTYALLALVCGDTRRMLLDKLRAD